MTDHTDNRALINRLILGADYAHDTEPMHAAAAALTAAQAKIDTIPALLAGARAEALREASGIARSKMQKYAAEHYSPTVTICRPGQNADKAYCAGEILEAILALIDAPAPAPTPLLYDPEPREDLKLPPMYQPVPAQPSVQDVERERIATELDTEADMLPCTEDANVVRSCARLVRANFSYDEAERLYLEDQT